MLFFVLAQVFLEEMPEAAESLEKNYQLPDDQGVTTGNERFHCLEVLFKPNLIGKEYGNTVLFATRISTMLDSIDAHMEKEIKALAPASMKIKIVVAWIGGSILSSSSLSCSFSFSGSSRLLGARDLLSLLLSLSPDPLSTRLLTTLFESAHAATTPLSLPDVSLLKLFQPPTRNILQYNRASHYGGHCDGGTALVKDMEGGAVESLWRLSACPTSAVTSGPAHVDSSVFVSFLCSLCFSCALTLARSSIDLLPTLTSLVFQSKPRLTSQPFSSSPFLTRRALPAKFLFTVREDVVPVRLRGSDDLGMALKRG